MYLKSIEMQGFKSFPDKTKLTFERGTTVVVGPNGSGKSNISDAMRWVLGELSPKGLRGSKMEDIIFGGASSRRPMGFAEVSVTFDNTGGKSHLDYDAEEVTVTRRYYRAGESEYYINRRACRLRDVYELFMNTGVGRDGYSIIGQGKIAEVISRKSEERRSIFEEAAGIAKYRHRKAETERKLQSTQENMTRVEDIFHEVEAQVAPLQKEADRAKRAIELHEQKKKVDVQLWLFDSERLHREIEEAEVNYRNSGLDLQMAESAIEDYNTENTRLFEEAQAGNASAASLLEEIRALTEENHGRDSQYHVSVTKIANLREKIESATQEAEKKGRQLEGETAEGDRRRAAMAVLEEKHKALSADYEEKNREAVALEKESEELSDRVAAIFTDIEEREAEAVDLRVRMQVIESNRQSDSGKNESMSAEIAAYDAVTEKLLREENAKKEAAEAYVGDIRAAEAAQNEAAAAAGTLREKLQNLQTAEQECRMQSDLCRQRRDAFRAMEENFEGYGNSVRFVMEAYAAGRITTPDGRKCGRIYGPLSKLITVGAAHTVAIETALGVNLQHIVVEDDTVAKAAVAALKKAEAGRATFFPVSAMRGTNETDEMREAARCEGYIGVAASLVSSDEHFRNIISSLLGRTVVFDNLDHAADMARRTRYRVRVVTLDGQVINAGGSFTGGSVKQRAGVLSRAGEIAALGEKLKKLTAELSRYQAEREKCAAELKEAELTLSDAESRRGLLLELQSAETAEADRIAAKREANEALCQKLRADFEALKNARVGYEEELKTLAEKEKTLRAQIAEISALRTDLSNTRGQRLDEKNIAEEAARALFLQMSLVQKDIDNEKAGMAESDARAEGIRAEIAEDKARAARFAEEITAEEARQNANRNTFKVGEARLAELNEKHARVTAGNLSLESRRNTVNEKLREKTAEKENILRAHAKNENLLSRLREEQDKLSAKFFEDHEMSRNDALLLGYEPLKPEERAAALELQTSCRNKLRAIGNVDLDAVNKYKEIKERYDYMAGQIADMTAARDDLLKIIKELEGQMKTSFTETFRQINENFGRSFTELFGGGSAEVTLSNPEDVLTSGIEIKVAPPGKIIKNLVQLSGGEQSFVAIALFFAILQVNPTPFFILDEIEAALDEVNVARFAAYIKRYSTETQFIIITHRRGTMEAADRLYGVTMPEHGISKVLALDVKSVSGKGEGDDWNGLFS